MAKTQQNNHAQIERAKRKPLVVPTYSDEHQTEGSSENHSLSCCYLVKASFLSLRLARPKPACFEENNSHVDERVYHTTLLLGL